MTQPTTFWLATRRRVVSIPLVAALAATAAVNGGVTAAAAGPAQVELATAAPFAVLGASTVTNTGPSILNGDLGLSPGTSVTGFPPGIDNGTMHITDAVATQAQSDLTLAYNDAAGRPPNSNLSGSDLGGLTLTAGVYKFDSSAQLTGTLTLNAQGSSEAVFIFQIGSTLTTASASRVQVSNGAQACHVFWQVGSSATLGTTTDFVGNVMALASITATTGATIDGRLLARTAAVTLDTNVITPASCASASPSITVEKSAKPQSRAAPGGLFTFSVMVTNTSGEDVVLSSLTDDVYGDLNGRGTCATGGTITAGSAYSCSFSGSFTGAAGDAQTDTVTATVTDVLGATATGTGSATVTLTQPGTGYIEICKKASGAGVSGTFTFSVDSLTVHVPVGACSGVIKLPAGRTLITEHAQPGYELASCDTKPTSRLVACDRSNQSATVMVVAGGTAQQTMVDFVNRVPGPGTGAVKVCKVAGAGVPVGTRIRFTVNGHAITVPAGPSPGGYCVLAGRFPLNTQVSIAEQIPADEHVSAISVSPMARRVSVNTGAGRTVITVGSGFTDVTFTDIRN